MKCQYVIVHLYQQAKQTTMVTFIKNNTAQTLGSYTPTQVDNQKEKAQILIEYANGGSFTINTKGIVITGRGVKTTYSNGNYEVTENKLNQLKNKYTWAVNF